MRPYSSKKIPSVPLSYKAIILAIFYALGLFALTPSLYAGDFENAITRANKFVNAKNYEGAIKEYKKAIALKPNDPKANLLLGLTYANTGENSEALKYTQASIKTEPSFAGYHNLGLIHANAGNYEKSVDAYKKALEISPEAYRAWYQLGLVYATDLKFAEAIDCYEKVLKYNPMFTDALLGLGSAYYWSGDTTHALEQVARLREAKDKEKADALEAWIHNTESKKSKK